MPTFKDSRGNEWQVEFDGLLLGTVRDECGVDLADPTGLGYVQLSLDKIALVRTLCVLCREKIVELGIKPAHFSKALRGDSLSEAHAAVWGAAENFFPQSEMSGLSSSYAKILDMATAIAKARPLARMTENMTPAMAAILKEMDAGISSGEESEPTATSSTGEELSTPASITPEFAGTIHAA